MNHTANVKGATTRRSYASPLREAQAGRTRQAILEALIRTMAKGLMEVSIPAVAKEAGVSIQTVYRHFGSKRQLVAALSSYVAQKARQVGLAPDQPPNNLDDLIALGRQIFRRSESLDATMRAAMASELGQRIRRTQMPQRREVWRRAIRKTAPDLAEADLERISNLAVILFSSASLRTFKDYLAMGPDRAADHVAWALRAIVVGVRPDGRQTDGRADGS